MITDVEQVGYGRAASAALRAAIDRAKAERALNPVTVIVPSNFAGLAARRLLGAGGRSATDAETIGAGGLVNVGFMTPFRLAELLGGGEVGDRLPLTNPVLGAAVRAALAEVEGPFQRVADHAATEAAVAAVYAELSNVSGIALERLNANGSQTTKATVELYRSIRTRLGTFHDEADIARGGATAAARPGALERFGHVIWYLPSPMSAPMSTFVSTVLAGAPSTVIVGLTGDAEADRGVVDVSRSTGVPIDLARGGASRGGASNPRAPIEAPVASTIVSVTDADEEVREVVRRIVALGEDGVDFDRIGIFHPTPDPYVRILEQQLSAAGIPANGPSPRRLADSVSGRTLLRAFDLKRTRWRRDHVMALVADAPVRFSGGAARPSVWEQISRSAGVVQDLSDWHRKLALHRHSAEQRLAEIDPSQTHRTLAFENAIDDIDALRSFVDELAELIDTVDRAKGWEATADATMAMLHALLGPGHFHNQWPEDEQQAFERVEEAIIRLRALESFEDDPSQEVVLRALSSELDVARGRHGRFGDGVVYGPLASAVGHDFDAIFILGCAEGVLPSLQRDDPLIPDASRVASGGEMVDRMSRQREQHRAYLAALSSAPAHGRTLSFPRGDLRSSRAALASRWMLQSASALAGKRVFATDFAGLGAPVVDVVASHVEGLDRAIIPANLIERDLAAARRFVAEGGDLIDHPVGELVATGLQAQRLRRSSSFTEWDGNLTSLMQDGAASSTASVLSPTRLETWAACGFRYFLGYVLELSDRDDPERAIEISALDKGSGVHQILEDFIAEVIAAGAPDPGVAWSVDDRNRLHEIADGVFADYERRGRTGRPVLWSQTRRELGDMLDDFLLIDNAVRAGTRGRPAHVELAFGLRDAPPVELSIPDGRTLRFRGMVDRLDQGDDGTVHVYDYKTGRGRKYDQSKLDADPFLGGTTLQLGLYAEAARQWANDPAVAATSHYWLVENNDSPRRGYAWTDDRRERFVDLLDALVTGIDDGVFGAQPGEWNDFRGTHDNCTYCDFDSLCPVARGDQAQEKEGAVELQIRQRLEPPEPDEDEPEFDQPTSEEPGAGEPG